MNTCHCCGASLTMDSRYCEACQTAWEEAPERHEANKLGLYGAHRVASFEAFEARRQHELGVSFGAVMGGAS